MASRTRLGFGNSSINDISTPQNLYLDLNEEFHFDFDPCPLGWKELIPYIDFIDGLKSEWGERNFVNPPFGEVKKWLEKGVTESKKGKLCVFLIPARVANKPWFEFIWPFASEVRFLPPIRFPGYKTKTPFGLAVIIFKGEKREKRFLHPLTLSGIDYVAVTNLKEY